MKDQKKDGGNGLVNDLSLPQVETQLAWTMDRKMVYFQQQGQSMLQCSPRASKLQLFSDKK
jgi:hypothetical protein